MGVTRATAEDMSARAAYRASTGTTFAHTAHMASTPRARQTIHESVDPKRLNTRGEKVRECLDSDAHPLTLPVVFAFDETGSMGQSAYTIQKKLATLKGATLRMGLVDAQLCFGAYGDSQNGEVAPAQIGQFESGLEMEVWLNNLFIEGNGGGNQGETPGLLLWFLANYSRLDSLTKRGKKGYLILTGDECPMPLVTRREIEKYVGETVERDFKIKEVVEQASELYDIYFFLVNNGAAMRQGSQKVWENLLGRDHVIVVEDLDTISEQVALLLAMGEGLVDSVSDGMDILLAEGANAGDVKRAGQAMEPFSRTRPAKGTLAKADGRLPSPTEVYKGGTKRL